MKSDLIDVMMILIRETEKAVLVAEDEEHDAVWLPKSLIEVERKRQLEHSKRWLVEVTMPEHLAVEKGLL